MPELSLVSPYYRNPGILRRHLQIWRDEWPADLKARVEVVLVDDGSPEGSTAAEVLSGEDLATLPTLSLYRVLVDKPWNQHGATNLGCRVARAKWILKTDIDHIAPPATLAEVLRRLPAMSSKEVLTLGRVDAPAEAPWRAGDWPSMPRTVRDDGSLKPHVNSYVVSRKRYWKLGGYCESFIGYGTDSQFRRKLFGPGMTTHHLHDAPLIRVDRSVIPDASTTTYSRETQRCDVKAVLARKALEGRSGQTTVLDFPWERVAL
jgi:hypothetical protein